MYYYKEYYIYHDNEIPFITILTPTYNRASLLPRLFDSLLRQTNKDFEWIVVDDGSTETRERWWQTLKKSVAEPFPWAMSTRRTAASTWQ